MSSSEVVVNRAATAVMVAMMSFASAGAAHANAPGDLNAGPVSVSTLKYSGGECAMKTNSPHWSRGAGSAIFKTRVECKGTEPPVVRITGDMFFVEGGAPGLPSDAPARPVAHSVQDQVVPIGATITYYTPLGGVDKLTAVGTYQGVATGEVVAPVHSNLTTETTRRSFVLPLL